MIHSSTHPKSKTKIKKNKKYQKIANLLEYSEIISLKEEQPKSINHF